MHCVRHKRIRAGKEVHTLPPTVILSLLLLAEDLLDDDLRTTLGSAEGKAVTGLKAAAGLPSSEWSAR